MANWWGEDVSRRALWVLILVGCAAGCTSTQPYVAPGYDAPADAAPTALAYRVFLVGDVGTAAPDAPLLRLLARQTADVGPDAAVVFLGDVLPSSMADPETHPHVRADQEARVAGVLQSLERFEGRVIVVPGCRAWDRGRRGGAEARARLEAFLERPEGGGAVMLPDGGLPGPVEVELTERLTMVLLDTQWWFEGADKPVGDAGDFDVEEEGDFLRQLADVVRRRDDDNLLVLGHHPVFSLGRRGGYFPPRSHLFPLTDLYAGAYLPLPLVGSLYPLYRRYVGGTQDLAGGQYRSLRAAFRSIFSRHERLVYAAAHDAGLQYFDAEEQHYLVSGGSEAPAYVARGRGAAFAAGVPGYMTVDYERDGTVWIAAWTASDGDPAGRLLFRHRMLAAAPEDVDAGLPAAPAPPLDYADSVRVASANPAYAAGPLKRLLLGRQHRAAWATPVTVPYLDLGLTFGGLTPVKRGGGAQTKSLRLERADGRAYVLRSIDKDPAGTVPRRLQGTVATDLVQDGIAALHPYAAFAVPRLADAAGVYHATPRLVYVPDDPRLGVYRESFAGRLMMIEVRPDGDMSDVHGFGGAREVVGASKLYDEIDGDNDHRVDQHAFATARLLDMLVSDWDRHRDQWRWAAFEPYELDAALEGEARTQGKVYRPIPRDRDWAFNQMNGIFPPLVALFIRKFQDFDEGYGHLKGLTMNGLEQDRRFTNALTRSDWRALARDLQQRLSDDVLEEAVRAWPAPVNAADGPETVRRLKARRDRLDDVADAFYELMAGVVDVVGSHKHERFVVQRRPGGVTEVVVNKITGEGDVGRELYRRTFLPGETREVRLYGLGGEDEFLVRGAENKGIVVTAVGGAGADRFVDASSVRGARRHTRFFDTARGNTWETGAETRVVRSDDPLVNLYDSDAYRHDERTPLTFFGRNQDDGVFVGGGMRQVRHGFRKAPYASEQVVRANFAARTRAFNVRYRGHFVRVLGAWNVLLRADWLAPNNVRNFYGLGNETDDGVRDAHYYQANLTRVRVEPSLERRLGEGVAFRIGPMVERTRVREDPTRYVGQPQAGISAGTFEDQWFAGGSAGLEVDARDSRLNPKQGFRWTGRADLRAGLADASESYGSLASALALYVSPSLAPQVTVATRAGGAHNVGSFPFFSASTLGGRDNLRGYRSTRFAGRTSFYHNLDVRAKLFDLRSYVVLGEVGLLAFVDSGRVWTDGEASRAWHHGYGVGAWATLFDTFALTARADHSVEGRTFTLTFGFFY